MSAAPECPSVASLAALGWDAHFAAQTPPDSASLPARVVFISRNKCRVWFPLPEGAAVLPHDPPWREAWAEVPGKLRRDAKRGDGLPVVGDWVWVRAGMDPAPITGLMKRKSLLARKAAGETGAVQVLAANVDLALVATSLNRDLNLRRLERYLALLGTGANEASGVAATVLLTKADLATPGEAESARDQVLSACPGAAIHIVSAVSGAGMDEVIGELKPGRTLVLLGSSGVGKSTLINRLLGADSLAVREIRASDDRGRHTTTARQMLRLPGGALMIDTPGMRELQLVAESGDALSEVFADIDAFAQHCRFRDCSHGAGAFAGLSDRPAGYILGPQNVEPGCAVWAAVHSGTLSLGRLAAYHKLGRETAHTPRRDDKSGETRYKKTVKRVQSPTNRHNRRRDA